MTIPSALQTLREWTDEANVYFIEMRKRHKLGQ